MVRGRRIDFKNTLLPEMSRELLTRMAEGEQLEEIKASLSDEGFVFEVE